MVLDSTVIEIENLSRKMRRLGRRIEARKGVKTPGSGSGQGKRDRRRCKRMLKKMREKLKETGIPSRTIPSNNFDLQACRC
jgi:hypothetical protein